MHDCVDFFKRTLMGDVLLPGKELELEIKTVVKVVAKL